MRVWLLWTLLALLCWGLWAVLSKLLDAALSAEQTQALSPGAIWLFNIQEDREQLSRRVTFAVLPIVLWGTSGFFQKLATN